MRRRHLALVAPLALTGLLSLLAPHPARAATPPTNVYFDQNEEEEFWSTDQAPYAGLATRRIVEPWDTNGQVCILPDGRFTSGYNPTGVEQKGNDNSSQNLGAKRPRKQPPIGVAIYNRDGSYSGQDLYVPGPYKLTPASKQWTQFGVVGPDAGGDVPPDKDGTFNSNGTFTGCTIDPRGNLFASDIGTSQGQFPPDDDGRLLEWFAPDYTRVCIVYGPTSGGDPATAHHVDGHGGLQQPGPIASDANGVYVPVDEADTSTPVPRPAGRVLKFAESALPATPAQCPGSGGTQSTYHVVTPTTFIDTTAAGLPFPAGIARDPVCACWAVDNVFFGAVAVAWFDDSGSPVPPSVHVPVPANFGSQFSPFGLAFDPQGDLFVVDIHVAVDAVGSLTSGGLQAGPQDAGGRLLELTFNGPVPAPPVTIASGEFFPVGVTTCTPSVRVCPAPAAAATAATTSQSTATATTGTAAAAAAPNTAAPAPRWAPAAAAAALVGGLAAARRRRPPRGRR